MAKKSKTTAPEIWAIKKGPHAGKIAVFFLERRPGGGVDILTEVPQNSMAIPRIHVVTSMEFNAWYEPAPDYPAAELAKIYKQYAITLGASPEGIEALLKFINMTDEEQNMARTKGAAAGEAKVTEEARVQDAVAASRKAKKAAPAEAKANGHAAEDAPKKGAKKAAAPAEKSERKPTSGAMFQELIMAGKLSDDDIFAAVQKKFGLDDNKRSYVAWYRNYLNKKGSNPPAAKAAK